MLQKQRVFGITNMVMNYLFLVFILLAGLYFVSYWFELTDVFTSTLVFAGRRVFAVRVRSDEPYGKQKSRLYPVRSVFDQGL